MIRSDMLRLIPAQETSGMLPETPHNIILANAFREIFAEVESNGNRDTTQLGELREKYFVDLSNHWLNLLKRYTLETRKDDQEGFTGEEIQIGEDRVTAIAIDAGYVENGVKLEIEKKNPWERAKLAMVIDSRTMEMDYVFVPEIVSTVCNGDMTTEYYLTFANGKILSMKERVMGDYSKERSLEFNRLMDVMNEA